MASDCRRRYPGVERSQVLDSARRADVAGFSTLSSLDRLVYPDWEPLVALSAAAAVTERIGLMTSLLLLPLRQNTAVLANQAATVHSLSEHRLTLGVGLGSREDDLSAPGVPMKGRAAEAGAHLLRARRRSGGRHSPLDRPLLPAGYAETIIEVTAKGEDAVHQRLAYFRGVGVDEVVMFPASAYPEQVDLLARIAL